MFLLHTMQFLILSAFVFCLLIFEISSSNSGVFHGIRIPDEVKEKLVGSLDPVVNVTQGTLEGKAELSRNGRVFLSFKNIPFGKVTERFNNAEPADKWKGTRKAIEYGPICSQVDIMTHRYRGQEDCLTLNVFVPKTEGKTLETLPVMFYIYGGAFVIGETGIYKVNYFMDEDVILVNANYRLGAFGFLNAGVKGASGNQALKDLVLALKWVQENIGVFGGDPSRVTIFGHSAGSALVSHLVISPMAKGLFSAAIAQSGAATVGWALWPDAEFDEPKKLAYAVDCPTSERKYMVECLRKIKPEVLAKATDFKDPVWFERSSSPVMAPSFETYKEYENDTDIFISENVETMYENGNFNRVPLMIGFNSHEGLSLHAAPILLNPITTKRMNDQWGRVAPQALLYWTIAKDPCTVSSKLRNAYFKGKPVGPETALDLTNLYSDIGFHYPAWKVGLKHAKFAPVYFYNFTREVKISFVDLFGYYKQTNPSSKPPVHTDDVQFLFAGLRLWPDIKKTAGADYDFSKNYVKLLASFAQNHKPTHVWGSQVQQPIEPVQPSAERHSWMQIDNELKVKPESEDFINRMKVLDEICDNDFDLCTSLHMK